MSKLSKYKFFQDLLFKCTSVIHYVKYITAVHRRIAHSFLDHQEQGRPLRQHWVAAGCLLHLAAAAAEF
jgi:hypothetical protein